MSKRSKKIFELEWIFTPLLDDPDFRSKRMFGGLAAYLGDRLVLVLVENEGDTYYRGRDYGEEIWNGIMIPTERAYHDLLAVEFGVSPHPVLGKWLYLSLSDEKFDGKAGGIVNLILSGDQRIGVISSKDKKQRG